MSLQRQYPLVLPTEMDLQRGNVMLVRCKQSKGVSSAFLVREQNFDINFRGVGLVMAEQGLKFNTEQYRSVGRLAQSV